MIFTLLADVPVDPDSAEAQRWVIQELSKPEYRAAQPTWFDRASKAFLDWLQSLKIDSGPGVQGPILILALIVIVAALVAAFFIFGAPRLNRRSAASGILFGDNDARDAAAMRRAAEDAAGRSDWVLAIEESFRSIARGLAERTLVTVSPGTTARDFAARAGIVLPGFAERLSTAASAFDDVRYLGREGTESAYSDAARLEKDLRALRPAEQSTVGAP
ncbi:DUF4129 domain-containing protein [Lacisediminihabitans sp. H27-G8]|uniref:DUF4129 domain-containing protein n=1 Tax=Lacisediminihabitans sp. H27-G8 TaxID=3111909 RepID=UPI0038FD1C50